MKSHFTNYRVPAAYLFTLLLPGFVPSIATAAAPTVTRYQFRGLTAHLESYSFSGSVETDVYVDATQGRGTDLSKLDLTIYQYDFIVGSASCYYAYDLPLTTSQIQFTAVANTLQSASLKITGGIVTDCNTGNSETADISITWAGSGPSFTGRGTYSGRSGPVSYHQRSAGTFRAATAAGSLVMNGTDFLASGDYQYTDASLQKSSYGEIDIIKPF